MNALTPCPPWLREDGAALMERSRQGRLPHALLLNGIDGIGKRAFAQWLAESLLCRKRTETGACGSCESCRQLLAGSHPDFRKLVPEGANATIKVDPVRELVEWLQLTASEGSYRVALLEQADTLNRNAANSLLKTLEEPGDHAVLILSATRTGALPATIRSRCQKITLKMHDRPAAIEWLSQNMEGAAETALLEAGGGPYAALNMQNKEFQDARELLLKAWKDLFEHKGSVGRISDSLSNLDTSLCLATFSRWALLAVKQEANLPAGADPDVSSVISETRHRLSNETWFTIHDRLLQLHRSDSASFKTQTVLEGIFADIRLMTNG
ncbi:DNA polymerase III subunit delta' [Granulosicoccus antarcticus]|uniref:DNA-directed DNA polymerase n=1 Tax=Granulosicoccus antarcticus IMCC3135 TaxID=1192854 RepID=A0A2Z2NTR4_9GAMM|nr:DNA polymerase III subunit delta' [Granulosicoccus antarcticus]ASJ74866.1 DNA polymerase III subunit delta' [Granulosicoccus antarcticus IMCC3135]